MLQCSGLVLPGCLVFGLPSCMLCLFFFRTAEDVLSLCRLDSSSFLLSYLFLSQVERQSKTIEL